MSNLDETVKSELLYDDSYLPVITKKWKQTEVDYSARDDIHTNRVGLTIPGVTCKELYALGIQEGFALDLLSFQFTCLMGDDKEFEKFVREELTKLPEDD